MLTLHDTVEVMARSVCVYLHPIDKTLVRAVAECYPEDFHDVVLTLQHVADVIPHAELAERVLKMCQTIDRQARSSGGRRQC